MAISTCRMVYGWSLALKPSYKLPPCRPDLEHCLMTILVASRGEADMDCLHRPSLTLARVAPLRAQPFENIDSCQREPLSNFNEQVAHGRVTHHTYNSAKGRLPKHGIASLWLLRGDRPRLASVQHLPHLLSHQGYAPLQAEWHSPHLHLTFATMSVAWKKLWTMVQSLCRLEPSSQDLKNLLAL